MTEMAIAFAAISALAAPAAQAETTVTDTDRNGLFSMEELGPGIPRSDTRGVCRR